MDTDKYKKLRNEEIARFSEYMSYIASKNIWTTEHPRLISFGVAAAIAGVSSHYLTVNYFGNFFYHLSGFIGGALNRILDRISSMRGAKEFEDPRLWEYGLDQEFGEASPVLPDHPNRKEVSKRCSG